MIVFLLRGIAAIHHPQDKHALELRGGQQLRASAGFLRKLAILHKHLPQRTDIADRRLPRLGINQALRALSQLRNGQIAAQNADAQHRQTDNNHQHAAHQRHIDQTVQPIELIDHTVERNQPYPIRQRILGIQVAIILHMHALGHVVFLLLGQQRSQHGFVRHGIGIENFARFIQDQMQAVAAVRLPVAQKVGYVRVIQHKQHQHTLLKRIGKYHLRIR